MNHPNRYPIHTDNNKGQTYGGSCNITACDNTDAVWWNAITHGLYCEQCAIQVNRWTHNNKHICFKVSIKPTVEQMAVMYREVVL